MENNKPNVVICAHPQGFIANALTALINDCNAVDCHHDDRETLSRLSGSPDLIIRLAPSTHSCRPNQQCKVYCEGTPILLISQMWLEDEDAVRAAGLGGYVGPDCTPAHILEAVRTVLEGGFFYHPGRRSRVPLGKLSPRQVDVMRLIGFGFTDQEIAEHLGIAETTVRHHLTVLHQKLRLERRGEIAALAALGGLCEELYRPPHERNLVPDYMRQNAKRYVA